MSHFLLFQIGDQSFALNLPNVERVVRAVEITPIPSFDKYILGIVDVQGTIIKAINTRKLVGIPQREIELSDQFIIINTDGRRFILIADSVSSVVDLTIHEISIEKQYEKSAAFIDSVARFGDSLVLVIDLKKVVSLIEKS
ncbi:MAG: chemotaxis protein CheW [Deltaproteobacteria bacterium]|nr:chemotaxis protein CheW [Deltaproteobacteria bacterium]